MTATDQSKISIEHVYKIFGPDPEAAMARVREGLGKAELLEEAGHVLGIRDVSLSIAPGEIFVVMGLSGSGKSTLIRHVNRLIEPTSGRIVVDGEDILTLGASRLRDLRRHKISMVFQRFALLPHKTVIENVAYPLEIGGTARRKAREHAAEQIALVGLDGYEDRYPRHLSGGMQQRVGLARALATDAEILLMDEAFSALDPLIRTDMQEQLKGLQERLHKTIMFITHDLDEALRIGDHIAILKDGELRQVGTGEEILLHPADDYVERFVRDVNRARVVKVGRLAEPCPTVEAGADEASRLRSAMAGSNAAAGFVLEDGRPVRVATRRLLDMGAAPCSGSTLDAAETVAGHLPIEDALPTLAAADAPLAVVDGDGRFLGVLTSRSAVEGLARR